MHLRKIKLAGFKSFVDPTTIELPGNLVGIVGPNGCGKSNVIDAVRWVMGEISAKHLRGDSMSDVVFSGSSVRKPTSQASVELIFDNSDGRLAGKLASFAEISVRRLVTRDAPQSSYYLNGVRCRRRDVTDVFLGTGLGPRSYAVIEQGMISRLIEAKPEELREFLEEAAGISKYKERRRETETRISHANENLDRLNDLRDELDKRLQHLKRQAEMAEKYKTCKQEERALEGELLGLRWRALHEREQIEGDAIGRQRIVLEAALAEQRKLERKLEQQRAGHLEVSDEFNRIYRQVLDAGAEIARTEESIQSLRLRRAELTESLERETLGLAEARAHVTTEESQVEGLVLGLAAEQPELDRLREEEASSREDFDRRERTMQALQLEWESLNGSLAERAASAQAQQTRSEHLGSRREDIRARIEKLELELVGLRPDALEAELATLGISLEREQGELTGLESALHDNETGLARSRERRRAVADDLHRAGERYQENQGRLSSLSALQEEALGKRPGAVADWLERHGLGSAQRLGEVLEVEGDWEKAVETVLGFLLEAVCVVDVDLVGPKVHLLEEGAVGLFDLEVAGQGLDSPRHGEPLAVKVRSPKGAADLLQGIFVVDDLEKALRVRTQLEARESVITPDGVWVGRNWLRFAPSRLAGAGVLSREQEIKVLAGEQALAHVRMAAGQSTLESVDDETKELEQTSAKLRKQFGEKHQYLSELRSTASKRQAALDQACQRAGSIRLEVVELEQRFDQLGTEEKVAREAVGRGREEITHLEHERVRHSTRRQAEREQLDAAREAWQGVRDDVYEVGVRAESMRTRLDSLRSALAHNRTQAERVGVRCGELRDALIAIEDPLREAGEAREQGLHARRALEVSLDRARERVEAAELELRQIEQSRGAVERVVEEERTRSEDLRVSARETMVRRTTVEEQLSAERHDLGQILQSLSAEAAETEWQERVERVARRIERLGPINLAAIEEHDQEAERKRYLDSQYEDLVNALGMLEQAIHKIDGETRQRFKDTYERVNVGLSETFPRLFGGGTAFLEMTGEDLLSTGISVMARPPGKRNTSIHLLSGGEKALTAIALVFSIFELNPAPFCLLDEVDAPLDDTNVVRFCELVKSMTDRVQCVVVTHNKTTMEMTHQLVGVTMNEPGISRLVTVDIDEAVELAAV